MIPAAGRVRRASQTVTGCVCLGWTLMGCCPDSSRDWFIIGSVVSADTDAPIPDALVDVTLFFAIDGLGNQVADTVSTDSDGLFTVPIQFAASCTPVAFGFFGSEASNTGGTPDSVVVTITVDGVESAVRFYFDRDPELITEFEDTPGVGTRGRVELPAIPVDETP